MAKEIVKKEKQELTPMQDMSAWGERPTVSKNDLLISKILLMQGMSKLVTEGDARMGEIRDSVTGGLLANAGTNLEIIPFFCKKYWVQFCKTEKGLDYAGKVEVVDNPADPYYNADWAWETDEMRNDYTYEFFCILPGENIPKVISFRRTSLKAGKKMFNQMYILNAEQGLIPPAYKMILSGRKVTADEGTYMVWDVERGDLASEQEIAGAFRMYKQITDAIQATGVKVDDGDFEDISV